MFAGFPNQFALQTMSSCKPRELQCTTVSKRIRDGFARHLSAIMFFECDEISSSTAFTVKTLLVFLENIFEFFLIFKQRSPAEFQGQKMLNTINLTTSIKNGCVATSLLLNNSLIFH